MIAYAGRRPDKVFTLIR
ncbi:hypothetical protein [Escherichia coli]